MKSRNARILTGLCLGVVVLIALATCAVAESFSYIQGNQFYYNGQEMKLKGSNYYPKDHFWADMWDSWDWSEITYESQLIDSIGLNCVRINVPYSLGGWGGANVSQTRLQRLEDIVNLFGSLGIRSVVTLFDWETTFPAAGSSTEADHFQYVDTIVNRLKDNHYVLLWDVKNEPDHPVNISGYDDWDNSPTERDEIVSWLGRICQRVRAIDNNHPVTTGIRWYNNVADVESFIDVAIFHSYWYNIDTVEIPTVTAITSKPVLVEEFGWPTNPTPYTGGQQAVWDFTENQQVYFYDLHMDAFVNHNIAGGIQWQAFDGDDYTTDTDHTYEDYFGIWKHDYTLKPGGAYYRDNFPVSQFNPPTGNGTLQGTVTDSSQNPISGATVTTNQGSYSAVTQSDGTFTINNVAADTYDVTASANSYLQSTVRYVVVEDQTTTTQDFVLTPAPSMQEKLVNGAFESGFFSFWGGDIANNWGAVWRGTFDSATWDDYYAGGPNSFAQEVRVSGSDFEAGILQQVSGLTPGASFRFSAYAYQQGGSCTAWMAADSSGGTTMPARTISFDNIPGQWNYREIYGTVGANGTVTVFLWSWKQWSTTENVYFDNASLMVETVQTPTGSIGGTVTDEDTQAAISGATVTVDGQGLSSTTASDGTYQIANVPTGTYSLTASKSGYGDETVQNVSVIENQQTTVDFALDEVPTQDYLVNGDFEDGFFTFWGGDMANSWGASFTNSASGATWDDHYFDATRKWVEEITTTNTSTDMGIAQRITGLSSGMQYTFSADVYQQSSGYTTYTAVDPTNSLPDGQLPSQGTAFSTTAGQWNSAQVTGTVGSDGEVAVYIWTDKVSGSNANVYIDNCSLMVGNPAPPGSIAGTVTDTNSSPVSGATITTSPGNYTTQTSFDGTYTLSSVAPDTYAVTAAASGYDSGQNTGVVVTSGQQTTSDFQLDTSSATERLINGTFESGFFSFWGGDMADNWGASFTNQASGATWNDHWFDAGSGYTQRLDLTNSTTMCGIAQNITGLTPGSAYSFSSYALQQYAGYQCYIAVDPNASLPPGELPTGGTTFSTTAGQWNYQEVNGTVGSGGSVTVYLWTDKVSGSNGFVLFNNASLMGQ